MDAAKPVSASKFPYPKWWPLLAGALAGLGLRFVFFGKPGEPYAAMMAAFIYFSPVLVGAVTIYIAETQQRRSWSYYFWAPFLANVLYVLGSLLVMIEGIICAVIIVPLFAVLGGVAGLIMGAICRATKWPKQSLYGIGILPFMLGGVESALPLPERIVMVERTTVINAAPEAIWRQILDAPNIRPEEVGEAWLYRIGVPVPQSGITRQTPEGPIRRVTMGKNVYFDQVLAEVQPHRHVRWTYRFYPDSFPPHALDEHVVLGGHYFDVKDTAYTLTPRGSATELKVKMHYRVSTQFNWYADPVAQFLIGNLQETNLAYYRKRSEIEPQQMLREAPSRN
jgi:hypothetical protein